MSLGFSPGVTYAKFIPGYDCSRDCFYCYNKLLNQSEGHAPIAIEVLRRTLNEAAHPLIVELIGGEPLEEPALSVTMAALGVLAESDKCSGVVLSTAVIAQSALEMVMPWIDRLYLSVDFSRSQKNRKRVAPNSLTRIVELTRQYRVEFSTSTVLFGDETDQELFDFIDTLVRTGVRNAGFGHVASIGLTADDIEVYARQFYQLFRLRLSRRGEINIIGAVIDSLEISLRGGSRKAECECGYSSVVIEPSGRLGAGVCGDHTRPILSLQSFHEIRIRRPDRLLSGLCGTCHLWGVCRGGCISEAIRTSGSPYGRAEFHCRILRRVSELVVADL